MNSSSSARGWESTRPTRARSGGAHSIDDGDKVSRKSKNDLKDGEKAIQNCLDGGARRHGGRKWSAIEENKSFERAT